MTNFKEEVLKSGNKDLLFKIMHESEMRTPVYQMSRPEVFNEDPSQFNVKGIRELIDAEYLKKSDTDHAYEAMSKLITKMTNRNS